MTLDDILGGNLTLGDMVGVVKVTLDVILGGNLTLLGDKLAR